jgi:hypothetical protein
MESYTRSKLSSRRKPKSKRRPAGGVQVRVRVAKQAVGLIRMLSKALSDPKRVLALRNGLERAINQPAAASDFNVFLASMPLGDENEELFEQIIARNRTSAARVIDLDA